MAAEEELEPGALTKAMGDVETAWDELSNRLAVTLTMYERVYAIKSHLQIQVYQLQKQLSELSGLKKRSREKDIETRMVIRRLETLKTDLKDASEKFRDMTNSMEQVAGEVAKIQLPTTELQQISDGAEEILSEYKKVLDYDSPSIVQLRMAHTSFVLAAMAYRAARTSEKRADAKRKLENSLTEIGNVMRNIQTLSVWDLEPVAKNLVQSFETDFTKMMAYIQALPTSVSGSGLFDARFGYLSGKAKGYAPGQRIRGRQLLRNMQLVRRTYFPDNERLTFYPNDPDFIPYDITETGDVITGGFSRKELREALQAGEYYKGEDYVPRQRQRPLNRAVVNQLENMSRKQGAARVKRLHRVAREMESIQL